MSRLLVHLMVVLMCMPSLVCAMPLCEIEIVLVEKTTHCGNEPQADEHSEKVTSPMLMADCGEIDLAVSTTVQLSDEELKLNVGGDISDLTNDLTKLIATKQRIRGSPNELFVFHKTPIYLKTERLRI